MFMKPRGCNSLLNRQRGELWEERLAGLADFSNADWSRYKPISNR